MAINTNNIQKYHTSHNNGNGGGVGVTYVRGSVNNASLPSELNVTKISASLGTINDLSGNSLNYNTGNFVYLNGTNGTVTKLSGQQLNYAIGTINDLSADNIRAGKITADELEATKAWIENLNSKYITTEYLTVTKQAHFFELIIDKVKSVGGTIINTAANAVIDYSKAVDSNGNYLSSLTNPNAAYYDVFWLAQESNGRKVTNDWLQYDQAYCQSFNNVSQGVNYNVQNKYYWRLVTDVLADRYMNLNTGDELPLGEQGAEPTAATENAVVISDPRIIVEGPQGTTTLLEGFQVNAQQIVGVQTGTSWIGGQQGPQGGIQGVMKTKNTIFGIEIKPDAGTQAASFVPDKFALECSSSRLNVGLYFKDDTSLYYPAPETARTHYEYDLGWIDTTGPQGAQTIKPDNSLEAIVITNADEVSWKLVHGIRLSNTICDETVVSDTSSIPTAGDNISQLGYRYNELQNPTDTDIERASAIIISACQTPDKGEVGQQGPQGQQSTIRGITPPSYAQYERITDFHLSRYRGTFMDAKGSEFHGDFIATNGQSIEKMIEEIETSDYQLFIAYSNASDGSVDFTKTPLSGQTYSYMGYCSKPIPPGETYQSVEATLVASDYKWSLVPSSSGTPGGNWVYAYKVSNSATTAPLPPNVNNVPKAPSELPYDGWYSAPQSATESEYIWQTQSFISGTGAQEEWEFPIRLTGAQGEMGTDADEVEFIYHRYTDAQTWESNNNNPAYWNAVQSDDYFGPTGYTWNDHPSGVTDSFKYEYVAQRFKKNGIWQTFSTPALWAKWGDKGQDGDGYEYIFKRFQSEQTWGSNNNNPAYWNAVQSDDYFGPTGYEWGDDPVNVSETYKYEYVAMRKKENGTWSVFSTPTLWAKYSEDGPQGPQGESGAQGPTGTKGEDADYYTYYPIVERAIVDSNGTLGVYFQYKIAHVVGTTVTYIDASNSGYHMRAKGNHNGTYLSFTTDTTNHVSTYQNAYYMTNYPSQSSKPIYFNIYLTKGTNHTVVAQSVVAVIFDAAATLTITDNIQATVSGHTESIQQINSDINNIGMPNLVMNGAFKKGATYWNNWGTPTTREITTDATGNKWMHIVSDPSNVTGSNKNWQGYSQNHYTDYDITVEAGQKYTVSLMAYAGSGTPTICVGFHWFTPSNTSTTADSQLWNTWTINRTPTKYTWTVTIPSGMNHFNIMVGDNTTSVQNFYISYIKMEKGKVATDWTPSIVETDASITTLTTGYSQITQNFNGIQSTVNNHTTSINNLTGDVESISEDVSQITQRADSIEAKVNDVSVKIDSGQITLNGDTNVNGTLTLSEAGQGFILAGSNGKTQITPESIGTYDNFINNASPKVLVNNVIDKQVVWTSGQSTTTAYWSFSNSFGTVPSGVTIPLSGQSISFRNYNIGGGRLKPSSITNTYRAYINGSLISGGTFTNSSTYGSVGSFTTTSSGTLRVDVTSSVTFNTSSLENNTVIGVYSYYIKLPKDMFTMIGYDGIASNFGNNNSVYFGPQAAYLRYGNHGLKITSDGIMKLNPNGNGNYTTLDTVKVTNITGSSNTYNVADLDEFLVVNRSGTTYIELPNASNHIGRKLYIKNKYSGANVYIKGTIRTHNDVDTTTQISIGNNSTMVLSDGTAWVRFHCGD